MHGIVTYHDGFNFGAYLQVYALHYTLKDMGYENKIINYKSKKNKRHEYRCFLYTKNPRLLIANLKKIQLFKKAFRELDFTKYISSSSDLNDIEFDTIVYGSDEIWNYKNPIVEKDLTYFGKGFQAKKRISYAVSCGILNETEKFCSEMKQCLETFDAISVRDGNTKNVVDSNIGCDAELVLDPTLIYDFTGKEVKAKRSGYIMFYGYGLSKSEENDIIQYARSENKQLISVGYLNGFCDESIVGIGPFEYLGYIQAADKVITTMFHGTLLSIKYQKEFCIFVDPYRTNKLEAILNMLHLKNRINQEGRYFGQIFEQLIDYESVNKILEREKDNSLRYLKRKL